AISAPAVTQIFILSLHDAIPISEILIPDEPTNGLDPIGIEEFREMVRSLHSRGKTILLSSHILSEVAQLVDHIGIINEGELKYQSPISHEEDLEALFIKTVRGVAHA